MTIKVLIVDDSPLTRDMLADLLANEPDMKVVGMASNGAEAISLTKELKPNVISMDIHMPIMEGFEAIETIMAENPSPILVVTDFDSSKTAFSAISKGALDIYSKKKIGEDRAGEYAARLRMLSKVKVIRHMKTSPRILPPPKTTKKADTLPASARGKYDIVAIASSTGGPRALVSVLSGFKDGFPVPIVIAQHMDDGFVAGFVEWLASSTPMNVKLASNGEDLLPSTVYLAPPKKHIKISSTKRMMVLDRMPGDIYHPSCNQLLSSVAEVYGDRSIGAILTGMGDDGAEGLGQIQRKGGMTIGQDENSCIVYGMPAVAAQKGYVDTVLPLGEIGKAIASAMVGRPNSKASQK